MAQDKTDKAAALTGCDWNDTNPPARQRIDAIRQLAAARITVEIADVMVVAMTTAIDAAVVAERRRCREIVRTQFLGADDEIRMQGIVEAIDAG